MHQPRVLVVDDNERRAQEVRNALAGTMLLQPIHRHDGESAVLWIGANECALCVISYELPGMNGLETLARIRTRRPDLPTIMYAESTDQHVAIAAFRDGVKDFLPAAGGFAQAIAEQAKALIEGSDSSDDPSARALEDPTLAHVPRERMAPTYQNRLRSIGRQLDIYGYHTITMTEVDGGFLVRAQRQRARKPQALEFPDRDFPRMVASAIQEDFSTGEKPIHQSDLTPTGYEDFLRALGYELDKRTAQAIVLTELEDMFVVAGRGSDDTAAVPGIIPFQMFLKPAEIDYMLNEAFNRRGKTQPKIAKPAGDQGGLRNILRRLN